MSLLHEISWKDVTITDGFWKKRQQINETVTLPAEYQQCKQTGRIDSIKCLYDSSVVTSGKASVVTIDGIFFLDDQHEGPPRPHHYWDSDIAKWIEAASYSLKHRPDPQVEQIIDDIVADYQKIQMDDGYLNTYFTVVEPGKRWTNVYQMHELYCAGHLMEAAVAYFEATGKRAFLEMMERYADHIADSFGPLSGQIHGYPGHQEIELALVKLYRVTGKQRYLSLAKYFLDARGQQPYFFELEARKYGRDVEDGGPKGILGKSFVAAGPYALFQSHLPIRQQKTAEGHAVRLAYMGAGAADVAAETGDVSLFDAAQALWDNVTQRRMSITGGIGAQEGCERFNFDYQLPNEHAYNETCAAIGLFFWSWRMLQNRIDGKYGDVMDKALYNGILSGVSLKGDRFFYANHLAVHPGMYQDRLFTNPRMFPQRQSWFPVSCCPMNLARLIESLGGYLYGENEDSVFLHSFASSCVGVTFLEDALLRVQTEYPWKGLVNIGFELPQAQTFTLAIRVPGWSSGFSLTCNGMDVGGQAQLRDGYCYIRRLWKPGDTLRYTMNMEPQLVHAHPFVRMDANKVALQCGPVIYCLEQTDNEKDVFTIGVGDLSGAEVVFEPELLGGVNRITVPGKALSTDGWNGKLYRTCADCYEAVTVKAIPYFAWGNRKVDKMTVWMHNFGI